MGASGFGDTVPREKVVNFVDYGKYFESLFTKATGGTDVTSMADPCGKTVAVESTDHRAGGRADSEREVHGRGQAEGEHPRLPDPDRRQPRPHQRPRAAWLRRFARGLL